MSGTKTYTTFWDFYPYYLTEHANPVNRALHFTGTLLLLIIIAFGIVMSKPLLFIAVPLCGYGCAWFGHFVFEKNKPATFKYPFYSLASDFVMFYHIITGQINKKLEDAHRTIGSTGKE